MVRTSWHRNAQGLEVQSPARLGVRVSELKPLLACSSYDHFCFSLPPGALSPFKLYISLNIPNSIYFFSNFEVNLDFKLRVVSRVTLLLADKSCSEVSIRKLQINGDKFEETLIRKKPNNFRIMRSRPSGTAS